MSEKADEFDEWDTLLDKEEEKIKEISEPKVKVKIDKSDSPPEIEYKGDTTESKNLQEILTKDESLSDLIQEVKKYRKENKTLHIEIEALKQEITTGEKIKSQSIAVKRMCITVLKQYQNSLTSPLSQDAIELLEYIGYNPEQIIEKIKKSKRKVKKK